MATAEKIDAILKQAEDSSTANQNADCKITKDEAERFKVMFQDPKFCKLFSDYVNELQDPQSRQAYEREIAEMEASRGFSVTFVHPEERFCLCLNETTYINVCAAGDDVVQKPTVVLETESEASLAASNYKASFPISKSGPSVSSAQKDPQKKPHTPKFGATWSIPHLILQPRKVRFEDDRLYTIIDICFNHSAFDETRSLTKCDSRNEKMPSSAFSSRPPEKTLIEIAVTAASSKLELGEPASLPKVNAKAAYFGPKPPPTVVRKKQANNNASELASRPSVGKTLKQTDTIQNAPSPPAVKDTTKAVENKTPKLALKRPTVEIIHREKIDWQDFIGDNERSSIPSHYSKEPLQVHDENKCHGFKTKIAACKKPREIVVRVYLPGVGDASKIEVNTENVGKSLSVHVPGLYFASIELPFSIVHKNDASTERCNTKSANASAKNIAASWRQKQCRLDITCHEYIAP